MGREARIKLSSRDLGDNMYEQAKERIFSDEDTRITPVAANVIERIRARYPDIPSDYLAFLGEVGWGTIAMAYVIYESPKRPSEIYGKDFAPILDELILFGDNMAGRCAGFDVNTWKVVEVLPGGQSSLSRWANFQEFVEHIIGSIFKTG